MTERAFITTKDMTVLAAIDKRGKIAFKPPKDGLQYDPGVYVHEANQLYDALHLLLPLGTWTALCKRMAREVTP